MQNDIHERQYRMGLMLLINLLAAAVAPNYYQLFPGVLGDTIVAFLAATVVLTLVDPSYARFLRFGLIFILFLTWQIILSNLAVARLVLQPNPKLDPGIIAIPLDVETELEITTLASAITLTPGTISIDLGPDSQGRRVLYIHSLVVNNPDMQRASIKGGFERILLHMSQAGRR